MEEKSNGKDIELINKMITSNGANKCPKKDKDNNCLVPGVFVDSEPVGGG